MNSSFLLPHLITKSAEKTPSAIALSYKGLSLSYAELAAQLAKLSAGLLELGLARGERVAIWLDKRIETVVASFAAPAAGAVFVPVNPQLKPEQLAYILRDCQVRVLITSPERLPLLAAILSDCHDLRHLVVTGAIPDGLELPLPTHSWSALLEAPAGPGHRVIDRDIAAILYTSGSTGRPKGVVLSHGNMVAGAQSVASYLGNNPDDTLLAALPLSFDAGFSQLTTAFCSGARVVLLNYLMPRDVIRALEREKVTGLTAVPPLWIQLTQLEWPQQIAAHLRYIANTGGKMPFATLKTLRERLPQTRPFLMYGLTEAFRATYLDPSEIDRRPDSIGKAIPNAEILVLREDGSPCAPNEAGELVQRGALVAQGYWNDAEKTAERFRPLPAGSREAGLVQPEIAVFSGDTVKRDEEGFLYFIGRRDEMIKTSGYRVSPTEIEEVIYSLQRVGECAAFGVPHPTLGQAIVLVATPPASQALDQQGLLADCRSRLPAWQVPSHLAVHCGALPRNPNGKIDRKLLASQFQDLFEEKTR